MNEIFDISKFDMYREDNRREVKAAVGGLPQNLWETYSSMANTYGGVIICGVREREDGSWFATGMKDASKLIKNFWNQANDHQKVSVNILNEDAVKIYEISDAVILVINVPPADREHKPVYINGDMYKGTFKRTREGDYRCTRDEILAMLRDQSRLTTDMKILRDLDLSVFDKESVKSYRIWFDNEHRGNAWSKLPIGEFMTRIGAADSNSIDKRIHPTCAGLLMFGLEHIITREYPNFFLDYKAHDLPSVRWTDRIQSQSPDWTGNIFDFFTMVSAKLTRYLEKPFQLDGIVRVDDTIIHKAVREALVNCLVNADYFLPRGVVIDKYPDKIIFKNPGTIIVGKKQMLRGGDSEPRNANIMKMLNLIGFGEHAGSGVPDILETWKSAGFCEPTVEECFGREELNKTIVTLPLIKNNMTFLEKRPEKGPEKGPENKNHEMMKRREAILELIRENPTISRLEIGLKLGITAKQVRVALTQLKNSNLIYHEGSRRGGRWIINSSS